jgi:hypothetical protein
VFPWLDTPAICIFLLLSAEVNLDLAGGWRSVCYGATWRQTKREETTNSKGVVDIKNGKKQTKEEVGDQQTAGRSCNKRR